MAQAMLISGSTRVLVPGGMVARGRIVEIRHRRETEADVLARALWLENHGRKAEADEYLDGYIRRTSPVRH